MTHDHDHTHDHAGHDHSHSHSHAPADDGRGDYYVEQLLTLLACGSVAVLGLMMWLGRDNPGSMLSNLLVPGFHKWVGLGSAALLLLTVVRGVSLWVAVGKGEEVGHVHGPDCDHGAHGPEHAPGHAGHAHSSGMVYLKVVPFALPVLMAVMGMPGTGFSEEFLREKLGKAPELGELASVPEKGDPAIGFSFDELNSTTYDPAKRAEFEGRRVRVKGQLRRIGERDYELYKLKMNCCAADMIPLKARIKSEIVIPPSQFRDAQWVTVEGVLQFVELPEKRQFLPVIRIGAAGALGLTPAAAE